MTPEAREAIKCGTCPAGDHEHRGRLVSCKGCGETMCVLCAATWIADGLCVQCHEATASGEYQEPTKPKEPRRE